MRRILITGGAGFIGSHLARRSKRENLVPVILDNFDPFYDRSIKEKNLQDLDMEFIEGNLLNSKLLKDLFTKYSFDLVFHLAALAGVRPSIERPDRYHEVNVGGTLNILEAAREAKVPHVVFASSSSVYGGNKKVPFSETDDVSQPISPYAATKKAGELYCHTFSHLFGLKIAALRYFTVYGPGQRPDLAIHKFTKLMHEGKEIPFFGDGTSRRDYTYVDDIVDGTFKAGRWLEDQENGTFEIFNLGNSSPVSLDELVSLLEKANEKPAKLKRLPFQSGDMNTTYADISKAKKTFGYTPSTPLETGLRKFVTWYHNQL